MEDELARQKVEGGSRPVTFRLIEDKWIPDCAKPQDSPPEYYGVSSPVSYLTLKDDSVVIPDSDNPDSTLSMAGLWSILTPEQRAAALAYRGEENHGDLALANDNRKGDFLQTYSGKQYYPLDPRAEDVCIEDIAHSLSLQCRYAGHVKEFYSVAEHSVHIAKWLLKYFGKEAARCGLLHDATESYLVDVPRPVKPSLTNYKAIEQQNWVVIAERFGLYPIMPDCVHVADTRIISDRIYVIKVVFRPIPVGQEPPDAMRS